MRDDLPDLLREPARPWPLPVRVLCGVAGTFFLMLGVLGVVLPLLPGVPFLILATILLGRSSPELRARLNELERRLPAWLRRALRPRRRAEAVRVEADRGGADDDGDRRR